MFAVTVLFQIKRGQMDAFLPAMRANAATSLEREPGCHHFDVCTDANAPDDVFLYELYADADAFQAHLESAHFREFDAAVSQMIISKEVRTFSEVTS